MIKSKFTTGLILFFLLFQFSAKAQTGDLVIVGGALSNTNEDVYLKFIELAGGKEDAFIAIAPTASGSPMSSSLSYKEDLIKYGVKSENIYIIPIAVLDDESTPKVDESKWSNNANNEDVVENIKNATGIWFTGGDQSRIIKVFRNEDGSNTPALNAIYETWNNGAVIGGSSAGAAMMSEVMITGGVSMAALKYGLAEEYIDMEQQDNGALTFDKGLGFFKFGIIDQHFDKKSRLGRLTVATFMHKKDYSLGFGIDENTALVYYSKTKTIESIGEGGITIVNVKNAKSEEKKKFTAYKNVEVSFIEKNDKYEIETGKFIINEKKKLTTGNEYFNIEGSAQSGIFSSYSATYQQLIAYNLVDNKANKEIVTYCFDDENTAFKVIFSKTDKTKGYWTNKITGRDSYSFSCVKMDIIPIKIKIKTIN